MIRFNAMTQVWRPACFIILYESMPLVVPVGRSLAISFSGGGFLLPYFLG